MILSFLSCLSVSTGRNRMNLTAIKHKGRTLWFPQSRAHLIAETLDAIKSGKATAISGDESAIAIIKEDFINNDEVPNKGHVDVSASYSQKSGLSVSTTVGISWAKRQEQLKKLPNKGSVDFTTSYSQDKGFGFDGTFSYEWAKRQEQLKELRRLDKKQLTKLLRNEGYVKAEGSYSQKDGWGGSVSFGYSWAKDGEDRNVWIKVIDTNIGRIYLPSKHEDTFQNLETQLLSGEVTLI